MISLNLPRIALEAKGDETAFWRALLDERLALARKALMTRIAPALKAKARDAFHPVYGRRLRHAASMDDDVSEIFKNGRASISPGLH